MSLDRMRIQGGRTLRGEIEISGAKNAALPLLALTLLTPKGCRITNLPNLQDVQTMVGILRALGADVRSSGRTIEIQSKELTQTEAPYDFVRKMRASVLLLGPLLGRFGRARVSMPGGCAIGVRPIDQHLKAFEALGAEIHLSEGYVEAKAARLRGGKFRFETVTVTGTANAIIAASRAEGVSRFENCAREPEVTAVAETLLSMGVKIGGIGTTTIEVEGVTDPDGFDCELIPDRIETGTYLVAGAITGGELFLRKGNASHLAAVIAKLRDTGTEIIEDPHGLRVRGRRPIRAVNFETAPFPSFPTDMQAQLISLLCVANGTSTVKETIFENRFMHVSELIRMGADLKTKGSVVTVTGVPKLIGAPVMATDLRASASLVLAGLAAEGVTEVLRIYHLDRGYERMETKLSAVGADIIRVPESAEGPR
ncbi:MAG: UDP-N-acetylglucosamine 1-carboxyvinyltransferase [Pseudomonadota bacterium]